MVARRSRTAVPVPFVLVVRGRRPERRKRVDRMATEDGGEAEGETAESLEREAEDESQHLFAGEDLGVAGYVLAHVTRYVRHRCY